MHNYFYEKVLKCRNISQKGTKKQVEWRVIMGIMRPMSMPKWIQDSMPETTVASVRKTKILRCMLDDFMSHLFFAQFLKVK